MRATVVIPCYRPDANFEKTLADLNAQTSEEFCVILADDGNQPPLAPRVAKTLTRPTRSSALTPTVALSLASTPALPLRPPRSSSGWTPTTACRRTASNVNCPSWTPTPTWTSQEQPWRCLDRAFGCGPNLPTTPPSKHLCCGACPEPPHGGGQSHGHAGPPLSRRVPLAEDYALWLHMASAGVRMANDSRVVVHYRMEGQNTSQNGAERRAARYTDMFKHAVSILLGDASARTMSSEVDAGCHHVLAGMPPPPECHPTFQDVESHAHGLRDALAQVHEPWADQAAQDLQVRLARAQGKGRWHKLDSVWALGRLRASDWRQLLSSDR